MSYTAILILNWNGAGDSIHCLNSLLPTLSVDDYLFIIDNGSTDSSVTKITGYFENETIQLLICTPEQLNTVFNSSSKHYLVCNKENLGFGAGNNVVLTQLHALRSNFDFAWLLNNDTLVLNNTLPALKESLKNNSERAAAGSLILNYPDNRTVQCSGVKHYAFFGVSKLINKNLPVKDLDKNSVITFDYLNGASLLLRIAALKKSGYFDEKFFLYSEEFDLQLRLQKSGYQLYLNLNSVVYHQLAGGTRNKKHLFYYYYNTSAVTLSKKHFSVFYTICGTINLSIITFVRTFPSFNNFKWGLKGIFNGLKNK